MAVPYYNRSAPFWDWVAQFEENATNHPGSEDRRNRGEGPSGPWDWAFGRGPWGRPPFPHQHPHPPPPHAEQGENEELYKDHEMTEDDETLRGDEAEKAGPSEKREGEKKEHEGERIKRCGRGPPGPHHGSRRGGPCGGGRGRGAFHGRGGHRGPPFGGPWNMRNMAEQLFGGASADAEGNRSRTNEDGVELFVPPVDVFDTVEAFVVHVSLAGAKKEDVAVSWDADKSELGISGVVHRPGDEDLLKALALDERKAGMFERKVRLGSRVSPAKVDADGITAKLEDGVLRIEVPKEDGEFVEVKKVDVE